MICGIQKLSLIDYPGKLAAVFFSGGCNMRCPFCHNPGLVLHPEEHDEITEYEMRSFLAEHKGLLDGIVFSGGEPTLQEHLPEWVKLACNQGYAVKLDTNGMRPDVVKDLYRYISMIGLDFKVPLNRYEELYPGGGELWLRTLHNAQNGWIHLDVRTTVHSAMLSKEDLKSMSEMLLNEHIPEWTLQQFHKVATLDETLETMNTYSNSELCDIAEDLTQPGLQVHVRGFS